MPWPAAQDFFDPSYPAKHGGPSGMEVTRARTIAGGLFWMRRNRPRDGGVCPPHTSHWPLASLAQGGDGCEAAHGDGLFPSGLRTFG